MRLVLKSQATAAKRRVYFDLRDVTDGITAETGEAAGQPQISTNGGAWTNTGIGTLTAIGNGRYYADLTTGAVGTAGDVIETRYKSAATIESPGDSVQVVAFDPDNATDLGLSNLDAAITSRNSVTPDAAGVAPTAVEIRTEVDSNSTELASIKASTAGLSGAAMRGTDSAALASVATEARLAELDPLNIPADLDTVKTATGGLAGAAMRGTDGANTVTPDAAGVAPTAVEVRAEIDSNSTQLAAIVADTNELQTDDIPGLLAAIAGYIDTEVAGIKVVTDNLATAMELDVGVYRFTTNALEQAPSGGGGGGDATEAKQDTIIAKLGTPADLGGGADLANNASDLAGATFNTATDSQEAIRNRGDAAWVSGAAAIVIGPVAASVNTNTVATTAGGTKRAITQHADSELALLIQVVDGNGDPFDIAGNAFELFVHDSASAQIFEINSTNEPAQFTTSESVASSGVFDQLTVTVLAANVPTSVIGEHEYKLWDNTRDMVYLTGKYTVLKAPKAP